jgi:hypothetical protein
MRETVLGFFDKYVKGTGDGSPVPEPAFATEPPESPELFVLPDPPAGARTMRDIARAMFDTSATATTGLDYIRLNGGLPATSAAPATSAPSGLNRPAWPTESMEIKRLGEADGKVWMTIATEPGLTMPVLYWPSNTPSQALAVFVSDKGKAEAAREFGIDRFREAGIACLAIDPRGLGELKGLEIRYTTYLGQAPAFGMGLDIVRVLAALAPETTRIAVIGRGPAAGQAVLAAALIDPRIKFAAGLSTLEKYADAFREDVPLLAVQPRANYAPALATLRAGLKTEGTWSFLGGAEPDWAAALIRWARK